MKKLEKLLKLYDYNLPPELIAQKPASPRDDSGLLVYRKSCELGAHKICFDKFLNLDKYLPKNAVLVFNETKVLPARLELKKETGGKVKILYIGQGKNLYEFLADRKLNIGSKLLLNKNIVFEVVNKNGKTYLLKLLQKPGIRSPASVDIFKILEKFGKTPIPPYIKNSPLSEKELRKEYQTIFAKQLGSVAAPTASLHFTKRVFAKLRKKGISVKFVTLHVNLGTFAPLTNENLKTKRLHKEFYNIDKKTAEFLDKAKKDGRPIIGVGTTVVRALESAVALSSRNRGFSLTRLSGKTQLFIEPGYKFKFIDGMVTNFHVPKSSLLMLVSALTGREKLLEIYQKAIDARFRFYSFGDGMLIL